MTSRISTALAVALVLIAEAWVPLVLAATFPEETPFTTSAFEAAKKDGKPVLVHVTADWCETCAAQKPILAKLRAEPRFKGLTALNINFDKQKDLVRAVGARMQSTLIVFRGDKEVGRSSGLTEEGDIAALLAKAF